MVQSNPIFSYISCFIFKFLIHLNMCINVFLTNQMLEIKKNQYVFLTFGGFVGCKVRVRLKLGFFSDASVLEN